MMRVIAAVLILGAATVARADREQQGAELFKQRCITCHAVAQGAPAAVVPHNIVDLTLVVRKHDDGWLRQWMANPHAVKPKSNCYTGLPLPAQLDQLLAFLHARSTPSHEHARPQHRLLPPDPQDAPPPPPPPGMVRGR